MNWLIGGGGVVTGATPELLLVLLADELESPLELLDDAAGAEPAARVNWVAAVVKVGPPPLLDDPVPLVELLLLELALDELVLTALV